MSGGAVDHEELVEELVEAIALGGASAISVAKHLLHEHPDADIDTFVLAACMAAAAIEEWYPANDELIKATVDLWKIAGILSCDGILLRSTGVTIPRVRDALQIWTQKGDPLF